MFRLMAAMAAVAPIFSLSSASGIWFASFYFFLLSFVSTPLSDPTTGYLNCLPGYVHACSHLRAPLSTLFSQPSSRALDLRLCCLIKQRGSLSRTHAWRITHISKHARVRNILRTRTTPNRPETSLEKQGASRGMCSLPFSNL